MNDHTAVIDRLCRAAERIDVSRDLESITDGPARLRMVNSQTTRRSHRVLLFAACLALIAAGGVGMVLSQNTEDSSWTEPASGTWQPPSPVPLDAPPSGSIAPTVASAPAWLTDLTPAFRNGSLRSGSWVSMAIARTESGGYDDPIVVSVFDGEFVALRQAETIDLNGQSFQHVQIGAWQALASTSSPAVMVEGAVDLAALSEVISAARIATNGLEISIALDSLPDDYSVIVAPQTLGNDATPRRTLASQTSMLSINEVSDWIDPLLYAAGVGTDLTRLTVGDTPAWAGTTSGQVPLTFLVWSPEPGVVLEITTTDRNRSIADLVALAMQTSAVPVADWEAIHSG